jgi:hypothetical protein
MDTIIKYKEWNCRLLLRPFQNGGYRMDLVDVITYEPIATLNKWLPGLEKDEVAIDISNCGNKAPALLFEHGIIEPEFTKVIPSGFNNYPVYKLTEQFSKNI